MIKLLNILNEVKIISPKPFTFIPKIKTNLNGGYKGILKVGNLELKANLYPEFSEGKQISFTVEVYRGENTMEDSIFNMLIKHTKPGTYMKDSPVVDIDSKYIKIEK